MTLFQLGVLHTLFRDRAAIRVAGRWISRDDIRRDPELAAALWWERTPADIVDLPVR